MASLKASTKALPALDERRRGICWRRHYRCNLTVTVADDADLLLHIQQ